MGDDFHGVERFEVFWGSPDSIHWIGAVVEVADPVAVVFRAAGCRVLPGSFARIEQFALVLHNLYKQTRALIENDGPERPARVVAFLRF